MYHDIINNSVLKHLQEIDGWINVFCAMCAVQLVFVVKFTLSFAARIQQWFNVLDI